MPVTWNVVWVTGAGTGIGREVALSLARRGVKVAISGRTAATLNEVASLLDGISVYPVDVTDRVACAAVVRNIEADLGPIDLAILNAGVWHPMSAAHFDPDKARQSMDVNYMGLVHGVAALMPVMIARRAGHIALVASVAGYRGLPKAAGYAPSKAAAISLAECLKPDLERHGVSISVVNPGFVETPMTSVNTFPMPFILKADDAAVRIIRGLERARFEVAFPWQLVLILKMARLLPYGAYFWFARTFLSPPAQKP
jgi:short-subunit dehydrogenase